MVHLGALTSHGWHTHLTWYHKILQRLAHQPELTHLNPWHLWLDIMSDGEQNQDAKDLEKATTDLHQSSDCSKRHFWPLQCIEPHFEPVINVESIQGPMRKRSQQRSSRPSWSSICGGGDCVIGRWSCCWRSGCLPNHSNACSKTGTLYFCRHNGANMQKGFENSLKQAKKQSQWFGPLPAISSWLAANWDTLGLREKKSHQSPPVGNKPLELWRIDILQDTFSNSSRLCVISSCLFVGFCLTFYEVKVEWWCIEQTAHQVSVPTYDTPSQLRCAECSAQLVCKL